jgi:hypothetical protein
MVMLTPTAYYRVGGDPIAIQNVRFSPAVFVECIGDNAYCLTERRSWRSACAVDIRWDEKAGLRRDALSSQVIDALGGARDKETGDEEA